MAYLALSDYGTTYIAVYVDGLDTSYSRDDRYIDWEIDGSSSGSGSLSAGDSCSGTQYFISLEPGTTYNISATIHYSSTPTSGVDSSVTVSGTFTTEEETKYYITMGAYESGDGTASVSYSPVTYGSKVRITATPYTDCEFLSWVIVSGNPNIEDDTSQTTYATIYDDCEIWAIFNRYYTVTVSVNNSAYGSAKASPSRGIYQTTKITLIATPNKGYEFVKWQVIYGNVTIQDNSYFMMPKGDVSIQAVFQKAPRPDYFDWDTPKEKGEPFNLTASEWNGLRANTNLVLAYIGKNQWAYQSANTGENFTADHYNEVVMAIQSADSSKYGTNLSDVTSGQKITASCLNLLVSELNAIP